MEVIVEDDQLRWPSARAKRPAAAKSPVAFDIRVGRI
jgi:hypothetical protein